MATPITGKTIIMNGTVTGTCSKWPATQVEKSFLQSKVDMAEDLGLPGLLMEEGFMTGLLIRQYTTLGAARAGCT